MASGICVKPKSRPHEQGVCRQVPKNSSQTNLLGAIQFIDCVRVKRSFQIHELTKTRRRSEIEENIEIPAKEAYNDISLRVAESVRRIEWVHRQSLCWLQAHAEIRQWHLLLHYSRTQAGVALSSAEAELNAALTLGCEILGICQFCQDQRRFICSKRHLGAPWMRESEALGGETAPAPRAGALKKLTSTRSLA